MKDTSPKQKGNGKKQQNLMARNFRSSQLEAAKIKRLKE